MQKRWYTGHELVERWELQPFEIYEFMKKGLQAYTQYGKKIINEKDCIVAVKKRSLKSLERMIREKSVKTPFRSLDSVGFTIVTPTDHDIKQLAKKLFKGQPKFERISPPSHCVAIDFSLTDDEAEASNKISEAIQYRFKAVDVEAFEKQHMNVIEELKKRSSHLMDSNRAKNETEKAVESIDSINLQQQSPRPFNFFTKKGSRWHIGFEGQTTEIDNLDGFFYIGYLLEKPGEPISCKDLYQAAKRMIPEKAVSPDKVLYSEEKEDQKLYPLYISEQTISDGKARQQYLDKYKELQNDLQKIADLPENEKTPEDKIVEEEIIKEMELLKLYLKERTFTDKDKKRFQNNVKRRLEAAYKAIDKAGMKKMAKHLQVKIKPDGAFGQRYIGDLTWLIAVK